MVDGKGGWKSDVEGRELLFFEMSLNIDVGIIAVAPLRCHSLSQWWLWGCGVGLGWMVVAMRKISHNSPRIKRQSN